MPFLTKVDDSNNIYLPFINNTKDVKEVKLGTLLGTFESLNFETVNAIQTSSERHPLFILDKKELSLMKGPPAKINVADP